MVGSEFIGKPSLKLALAVGLLLASGAAQAAEAEAGPCPPVGAEQPKKKRGGLGGLFAAAKNAGVGRVLGSGGLGSGAKGQVLGAVAGTAIEAAGTASAAAGAANAAAAVPSSGCPPQGSTPVGPEIQN